MGDVNNIIAALDVGTTTIRCHIINGCGDAMFEFSDTVELFCPKPGEFEIKPDIIWKIIVNVISNAIKGAGLQPNDITCMGISCQRATFITWNKNTGKPYHNFITWQDLRADSLVQSWNHSLTMKTIRSLGKCLYMFSRRQRHFASSGWKFINAEVTIRLLWVIQNIPEVKKAMDDDELLFGTLDSWLIYKLTNGNKHLIEVSCASATGLFDPYVMDWLHISFSLFNFKPNMFPKVCDSAGDHFGSTAADIFGSPIPIRAVLADQSASLFGSCCFEKGDAKITIGTGAFFNVNVGNQPNIAIKGLYPLVGWRYKDDLVFTTEGSATNAGTLINWSQKMGFLGPDPSESNSIVTSVPDNDGVYFIPAFNGIKGSYDDGLASAGFIGVKRSSRPAHFLRAVLESIAFQVHLLHIAFSLSEYKVSQVAIDGGVSRNNFIVQLISDLTGLTIERAHSTDMSILGAGYLAGLASGIWKSKKELKEFRRTDKIFKPRQEIQEPYLEKFSEWNRALTRFLSWYKPLS